MGSIKRAVKKIARPKVLLPLAALAIGGPMLAKAAAAKSAAAGTAAAGAGGGGIGSLLLGSAGSPATAAGGLAGKLASGAIGPHTLFAGPASTTAAATAGKLAALSQPTAGVLGFGGAFAPLKGTLAKGAMYGLKNPFTKQGLMTYGAGGLGLAALMGKEKTEAQKNLGVDAQAQYDLAREMNRMMGGAYTDEQLNTIVAPMLSQYGGEYETITGPKRKRRPMFPGLNYSGLTRYAADGGTIVGDDELSQRLYGEMMGEQMSDNTPDIETLQGIKDYIDYLGEMDQAEKALREEVPNPTGRAMGGRIEMGLGGFADGGAITGMTDMINQSIDQMQEGLTQQVQSGFTTQEAIVPKDTQGNFSKVPPFGVNPIKPPFAAGPALRPTLPGFYGNPPPPSLSGPINAALPSNIGQLSSLLGYGARRGFRPIGGNTIGVQQPGYADGGSIPQTKDIPAGMQLDGRGGGFIPMGARERKDDVPAMLAKNEFVMTADAVRGMGNGDVNQGAQRMYDLMNNLESKV